MTFRSDIQGPGSPKHPKTWGTRSNQSGDLDSYGAESSHTLNRESKKATTSGTRDQASWGWRRTHRKKRKFIQKTHTNPWKIRFVHQKVALPGNRQEKMQPVGTRIQFTTLPPLMATILSTTFTRCWMSGNEKIGKVKRKGPQRLHLLSHCLLRSYPGTSTKWSSSTSTPRPSQFRRWNRQSPRGKAHWKKARISRVGSSQSKFTSTKRSSFGPMTVTVDIFLVLSQQGKESGNGQETTPTAWTESKTSYTSRTAKKEPLPKRFRPVSSTDPSDGTTSRGWGT